MLVRNGFNYLTYFETVFKISKAQAISKRLSFSKVCLINTQHLDMHSPIIRKAIQTTKKRQKSKPIKRGFSVIVKSLKL